MQEVKSEKVPLPVYACKHVPQWSGTSRGPHVLTWIQNHLIVAGSYTKGSLGQQVGKGRGKERKTYMAEASLFPFFP